MNHSTKTRRTGGTQLPEPELQALNTILASFRAWKPFQEHTHELCRITDKQQQKASELDLSEIENSTQVWLDTANSAETAGAITPAHCFFVRVSAVERVHFHRSLEGLYKPDLAGIVRRMNAIEQREGLNVDEYWPIGEGPEDWEELGDQYSQVMNTKFEETLREYGLEDIADLYRDDRESYDARREQGRRVIFENIPELEQLSALQKQFEAEAEICAEGGAYHAAGVMIGSAIEAALLFTFLNHRDDALKARDRLPDRDRPKRANPKKWSLREFAMVADEAGWLPDFRVADGTIRSRLLLDMMRSLRNLTHPVCQLSDMNFPDIQFAYTDAKAAYTLLKWHLTNLHP